MRVITGFGYIRNKNDEIVEKYVLPPGEHPLSEGYTNVEVRSEEELNSVVVGTLLEVKAQKVRNIKGLAQAKILTLIPGSTMENYYTKEIELLARTSELIRKESKGTITSAEMTELNTLESKWNQIKSIKTASNQIEAEVDALPSVEAVSAYDEIANTLWPA